VELERIVQTVNRLAWFFWHPLGFRDRNEIHSMVEDWRAAFQWFLSSFAFERQGRSPYYSDFAVEAVELYDGEIPGQDFEEKLWDNFLKRGGFPADGEGANKKNNPLAPSDNGYSSASRLVSSLEDFNFNVVQWALSLAQSGDVKRAWNKLVAIRGIGDKIASLYLRDIVDAFEIDEDIVGNKVYLQPIDAWTRRGAKALAEFMSVAPKSDWDLAEVLIEVSERASVRSTYTNTGLWFLGAQLVRDKERFHDLLLSVDDLHDFLRDEMYRHRKRAEILETVLSASGYDTQKAVAR
jgi:hypothetical protein